MGTISNDWQTDSARYAALLLRLALAALFIAHIARKFLITGIHAWWLTFTHAGYPSWILIYVLLAEFSAAIALSLGIYSRVVSVFALPSLLGAAYYQFLHHGYWFVDGGAELPLLWALALLVQALLGDGACSLARALPATALAARSR